MSISIGSDLADLYTKSAYDSKSTDAANKLTSSLSNLDGASDEEMLEACKDFEAYFVEKLLKMMHDSVKSDEEEDNAYLLQFGDMRYEEYAKQIADSGELGIAQQLYEAMKKN